MTENGADHKAAGRVKTYFLAGMPFLAALAALAVLQTWAAGIFWHPPHIIHSVLVLTTSGLAVFISFRLYEIYEEAKETKVFALSLGFFIFGTVFIFHALALRDIGIFTEAVFDVTEHYGFFLGALIALLGFFSPGERLRNTVYRRRYIIFWLSCALLSLAFALIVLFPALAETLENAVDFFIVLTLILFSALLFLFFREQRKSSGRLFSYLLPGISLLFLSGIIPLFYREFNILWWYFHLLIFLGLAVMARGFYHRPADRAPEERPGYARFWVKLLTIILPLSVIPLAAVGYFIFKQAGASLKNQAVEDLTLLAESKEGQLLLFLDLVKSRTADFSSDGFIRDSLERIAGAGGNRAEAADALNKHLTMNKLPLEKHLLFINVIDERGRIVASTKPEALGEDESRDNYFIRAMRLPYGEVFIDDVKLREHAGIKSVSITASAPLTSHRTLKTNGVIALYFKTEFLDAILAGEEAGGLGALSVLKGHRESLGTYLVNKNKLIIAGSPGKETFFKEVSDTEPVRACLEDKKEIKGFWRDWRGTPVLGASMCFPEFNWTLVTEISEEEVLRPVAQLRQIGELMVLLIGFISVIVGLYFSATITRPLKMLDRTATRISAGEFNIRADVSGKDEIGSLARSFNAMADFLIGVNRKLRQKSDELARRSEELKAARNLYFLFLSSIGEGVLVVDLDRKITLVNKAAERILGYEAKETIGRKFDELLGFIHKDKKPLGKEFWESAYEAKTPLVLPPDISIVGKGGRIIPVADVAAPIIDPTTGEREGIIVTFRDVREERALEEARLGFISIASHQLRTPLTSMRWFSEMLIGGDAGSITEEQKHFVERIYQGTDRMISLVNLLLQIARVEAGRVKIEPVPVDLKTTTQGVILTLKAILDQKLQKVTISTDPDPLPLVRMDQEIIWQVIQNILSNAIRYSPEKAGIAVAIEKKNGFFEYAVKDEGIGIPGDQQPHIFEKFFRAENALKLVPEGSGLGLSLVKMLVEGWGGKIWFESEEGKGTAFYFTIPAEGMKPKEGEVKLAV